MTPCYTRHETAPGTHADIPHEHENGKPMNQSFKEAAALLSDEPSQYEIERAKVLATLALAYEQRTANMIAWAGGVYTPEMRTAIPARLAS